jgi:hypothetical protein
VSVVFVAALATLVTAVSASPLLAQSAPTFRQHAVTFAGGALFSGGYQVGDVTATLRRNAPGTPSTLPMLRAESAFENGLGVEGRVSFALTESWGLEAAGSFSRPDLGVVVSQDAEVTGAVSSSERVDQYGLDGSVVYQLPYSFGRRSRPYVIGGGGYLRQLHEERVLVETGYTLHVGGGLQYWWRSGGSRRPLGLRAEARLVRRHGGIEYGERARQFPALSILAFIGL